MSITAPAPTSVLQVVRRHPFYRNGTISLFLSGLGVSVTAPSMALYFVDVLGASYATAGFYYLTNLAAPIVGFLLGSLSDRQDERLRLFKICTVVGGVGWLAMAAAGTVWLPFVINIVALSVGGAAGSQIFAAARDELSRQPVAVENRVIATMRMGFTGGWVIGPVIGSWFGAQFGLRALFVGCALCSFAQLIPLARQRVARYVAAAPAGVDHQTRARGAAVRDLLPLLIFTALCVLAMSGDTIKFAYLPLYMQELGVPDAVRGAVIAVQPLVEFILMPFAARLADRIGPLPVVIGGVVLAVAANVCYATSTHVVGLFAGQLLMSGTWAALGALGVSVAQALYPQGVGTASGTFMSSMMLGSAVGGLVGGLGVSRLGLPHLFLVPACLTLLAVIGLSILAWRWRRAR